MFFDIQSSTNWPTCSGFRMRSIVAFFWHSFRARTVEGTANIWTMHSVQEAVYQAWARTELKMAKHRVPWSFCHKQIAARRMARFWCGNAGKCCQRVTQSPPTIMMPSERSDNSANVLWKFCWNLDVKICNRTKKISKYTIDELIYFKARSVNLNFRTSIIEMHPLLSISTIPCIFLFAHNLKCTKAFSRTLCRTTIFWNMTICFMHMCTNKQKRSKLHVILQNKTWTCCTALGKLTIISKYCWTCFSTKPELSTTLASNYKFKYVSYKKKT